MKTWRQLIEGALNPGDSIESLTFIPQDLDLDRKFDNGFGAVEGEPFVAYSDNWIYFCVQYDGNEWVGTLPTHPIAGYIPTHHGGG